MIDDLYDPCVVRNSEIDYRLRVSEAVYTADLKGQ